MYLVTSGVYGRAVIALLAWYDTLLFPKVGKDAKEVVSHAIFLECLEKAGLIYCIVGLAEIQVHLEEG